MENEVLQKNMIVELKEELNRLDKDTIEIITLKVWEGLKFNEIAEIIKISSNSVKTKYYRGVEQLKNNIESKNKKLRSFALPVLLAGLLQIAKQSQLKLFSSSNLNIVSNLRKNLSINLDNIMTKDQIRVAEAGSASAAGGISAGAVTSAAVASGGVLATGLGKVLLGLGGALVLGTAGFAGVQLAKQQTSPAPQEEKTKEEQKPVEEEKVEKTYAFVYSVRKVNSSEIYYKVGKTGKSVMIGKGENPAISNDGKLIVFTDPYSFDSDPGNGTLYIYNIQTKKISKKSLSKSGKTIRGVQWSPDDSFIAVEVGTDLTVKTDFYGMKGDNKNFILSTYDHQGIKFLNSKEVLVNKEMVVSPARPYGTGRGVGVIKLDLLTANETTLLKPTATEDFRLLLTPIIESNPVDKFIVLSGPDKYTAYSLEGKEIGDITPAFAGTHIKSFLPDKLKNLPVGYFIKRDKENSNLYVFQSIRNTQSVENEDFYFIDLTNPQSLTKIANALQMDWSSIITNSIDPINNNQTYKILKDKRAWSEPKKDSFEWWAKDMPRISGYSIKFNGTGFGSEEASKIMEILKANGYTNDENQYADGIQGSRIGGFKGNSKVVIGYNHEKGATVTVYFN